LLRFIETPAPQQARAPGVLRGPGLFIASSPGEQYLLMPKGFAIMALSAYPTERSRDRLIAILGKRDNRGIMRIDVPQDSPLRGFAALALGLYAAPYETPQGPADRPNFDWAIQTLSERLEDANEDPEVRSACAVALGLTQRTAVLPALHGVTEKLNVNNAREVAVFGYVLLGRALAGDQAIHQIAEQFLLGTNDDTSATGILSRRAAVLALGVLRTPTVVPVLTKAWHLNHYVNREVIVALRLAGASNAASLVLARLRESNDRDERAYMAGALGELLAAEHPTPLNRLIADSNYTVRNDHLRPLQRMANEFLFDYLIPSLGEQW